MRAAYMAPALESHRQIVTGFVGRKQVAAVVLLKTVRWMQEMVVEGLAQGSAWRAGGRRGERQHLGQAVSRRVLLLLLLPWWTAQTHFGSTSFRR